jgi:hypothetical protein
MHSILMYIVQGKPVLQPVLKKSGIGPPCVGVVNVPEAA